MGRFGSAAKAGAKEGWGDAVMLAASIGDSVIEGATGFDAEVLGKIGSAVGGVKGTAEAMGKTDPGVNPYFVYHQVDELDVSNHSPSCKKYFKQRKLKKIGGSVASAIGGIASSATGGVNTLGIARHARAEANTLAHLYKLRAISKQVKQSKFLTELVTVMIKAKGAKAAARGGQLFADCIPNVGVASAIISGVAGGGAAVYIKTLEQAIGVAAIEIQWRAYQESAISRVHGGTGPAMRMVHEIFNGLISERRIPRLGVPAAVYIREPHGHLVLRDKLLLI